ncbi:phospholipase A and acyltransferase 4-like isoform X1 [Vicugna pacos]|uniref:Phospholipase A and acyltransferase 4-like isoform X1 n=1 Tax=Vicugna pacos TaxID=30538 RepID=A0ABM5DZE0_VICPA
MHHLYELSFGSVNLWELLLLGGGFSGASSSSLSSSLSCRAVVKLECLENVVGSCRYRINNYLDQQCSPWPLHKILKSAYEKIGEDREYCLICKNCEHFVTYLRYGKAHCSQLVKILDGGVKTLVAGFLIHIYCLLRKLSQSQ